MNRLDKDISNAIKQLRSFIAEVNDSKYQNPSRFIKGKGFNFINPYYLDGGSEFLMAATLNEYGPEVVYTYDEWSDEMIVMFVGIYNFYELQDSKRLSNYQKSNIGGGRLVYITYLTPEDDIQIKVTSLTDGWSSLKNSKVYGYYLKKVLKFMNWDSNPLP